REAVAAADFGFRLVPSVRAVPKIKHSGAAPRVADLEQHDIDLGIHLVCGCLELEKHNPFTELGELEHRAVLRLPATYASQRRRRDFGQATFHGGFCLPFES